MRLPDLRLVHCAIISFAASALQAQTVLDQAKPDLQLPAPQSATGPTSLLPLLQLLFAVGIVVWLLKWLLPKAVSRIGKRFSTPLSSLIKIEQTATFGAGTLYIVEVDGRRLLLCASAQGVSCLADLSPTPEAQTQEPFISVLDQASTKAESELFRSAVSQLQNSTDDPSTEDARVALERLRKLAGTP